ncbi:MAG: HAMP domain-containing protein [Nitrospinae bacterium]|nr:HAMP domain-containing protein [Nitrospinota bacterium]
MTSRARRQGLFWRAFIPAGLAALAGAAAGRWFAGIPESLAAALAAGALAAAWINHGLARPLELLRQGVARFALGSLDAPVARLKPHEFDEVGEALNHMAAGLERRIRTLGDEAQSLDATLTCVQDGVIAVSPEMRVLTINPKAREILNILTTRLDGLALGQVCAHGEFLRFVEEGLASRASAEREIAMDKPFARAVLAIRSPLFGAGGERRGLVVALNDITRMKRLENLRREFAANVSHELRTPVTAIKGFVENLRSGAIHEPENASRFLSIIERHIDRLGAIIEDLLSLSKLEHAEADRRLAMETHPAREVILRAVEMAGPKAKAKGVAIEVQCPEEIAAPLNAPLMEQAALNLIDNAINHSPEGGAVWVTGAVNSGQLSIIVRDRGCGIERQSLDRLFERFYRVDEARSRKLGGTGLGLSIVKHIALAHGGRVSVESAPGEGSVFSIHIPAGAASRGAANGEAAR